MKIVKKKTWAELQNFLFGGDILVLMKDLDRYRSHYLFRGLSISNYELKTSLIRLGGDIKNREKDLLRNFRKYASRDLVEYDSIWHWLTLGQHHGLPTRLLDWTFSPYVALHFATGNVEHFEEDGIIWAVNYNDYHQRLPQYLLDMLIDEGAQVFTVELLADSMGAKKTSFKALDELEHSYPDPYLVFFEPPSIDERIVNQASCFSFLSKADMILDEFLKNYPISDETCLKIIIPKDLKWEIRDKLDQSNITERVLFPGLDGLTKWLTRYYSPKK